MMRTKELLSAFVAIHGTLSYYELVTFYKQCLIMLFVTKKLPLARYGATTTIIRTPARSCLVLISRAAQEQANVKQKEQVMSKFNSIVARFLRDEEGASLIEYSILIGLITALVIAIIVAVGTWVQGAWTNLNAQLT